MAKKILKKKIEKRVKIAKKTKPTKKPTLKQDKNHPYKIGKIYIIRTVTMYLLGRLTQVFDKELVLEECSWIPDSGRWSNALNTGNLNEVEPFIQSEPVIIGRGSIIDCQVWMHSAQTQVK